MSNDYLIERTRKAHPLRWKVVGAFAEGSKWRDGRPVDDETMLEEAKGYRKVWPDYLARVRRPDGVLLADLSERP